MLFGCKYVSRLVMVGEEGGTGEWNDDCDERYIACTYEYLGTYWTIVYLFILQKIDD